MSTIHENVSMTRLRPFRVIARLLPRTRRGRPVHVATLYRWRALGHRGVTLRSVRTPGGWTTSLAAVKEFFDQLTALEQPTAQTAPRQDRPQEPSRQAHVEKQLRMFGI